jgi:AP-3 complex subunit beta
MLCGRDNAHLQPNIAKLQILTLATKLLVLSPTTPLLLQLSQYLFTLARYDQDYDIRDRARFLNALQRGVKDEKTTITDEEEDVGGVVLRREQVKVVLLSQQGHTDEEFVKAGQDFNVGSMSRLIGRKLNGYFDIPDWTDDPTDPSLRESELDDPIRQAPAVAAISSASHPGPVSAPVTTLPVHLSSANISRNGSPAGSSPVGSLPLQSRAKFQDLDAFLDSESEESSDESERYSSLPSTGPVIADAQ